MPTFRIEGKVYEAADADEAYDKHDAAMGRKPDVTVTKIGNREIPQADEENNALLTALGKATRVVAPYAAAAGAGALAGAPIGGVGAIPGAIAGMTAYGLGSLAGDVATGGRSSQAVENLMTRAGLPELETPLERITATGIRGALGGFSGAGSASALAAPRTGQVAVLNATGQPAIQTMRAGQGFAPGSTTQRVFDVMAQRPVAQTVAGGTGALGAQATSELGAPQPFPFLAGLATGSLPFMMGGGIPRISSTQTQTAGRQQTQTSGQPQPPRTPQQVATPTATGSVPQPPPPPGGFTPPPFAKGMPESAQRGINVERLQRFGVPVSRAQISGNPAQQTMESVLKYLPASAPKAARFIDEQMAAFNRALLRFAGIDSDRATTDVLDAAQKRFGTIYDQLETQTPPLANREDLFDDLANVTQKYQGQFSGDVEKTFGLYANDVLDYLTGTSRPNQTFQQLSSSLSEAISRASLDTSPSSQRYENALRALKGILFQVMETNAPPSVAQAWRDTNRQYAIFSTIKDAMRNTNQETLNTGYVNPRILARLQQKERSDEWIMGNPAEDSFTNLVKAGAALIPDPIPNSGTAQRTAMTDILQGGQRAFGQGSPMQGAATTAAGLVATGGMGIVDPTLGIMSVLGPRTAAQMYYGGGSPGANASMAAAGAPPTSIAPVITSAALQSQPRPRPKTRRERLAEELQRRNKQ